MKNKSVQYLEYPTRSMEGSKAFFNKVFGWKFVDYGEQYSAFSLENVDGGFYYNESVNSTEKGAALTVFYSNDLAAIKAEIEQAEGKIIKDIFAFPGGHRFHFTDPGGSEFAVWSDCYSEKS